MELLVSIITLAVVLILLWKLFEKLNTIITYQRKAFFFQQQDFINKKHKKDLSVYEGWYLKQLNIQHVITKDEYEAEIKRRKEAAQESKSGVEVWN